MRLRLLKILFVVMAFSVISVSASAVPLLWTLNGVNFNDGGTASGTFVYDADTTTYSAINITTTTGGVRTGATYACAEFATALFYSPTCAVNLTGVFIFWLFPSSALTNGGGSISLTVATKEATCLDAGCSSLGTVRNIASVGGGSISAPVPVQGPTATPTLSEWSVIALSILLAGTGAVGLRRFRKRR